MNLSPYLIYSIMLIQITQKYNTYFLNFKESAARRSYISYCKQTAYNAWQDLSIKRHFVRQ